MTINAIISNANINEYSTDTRELLKIAADENITINTEGGAKCIFDEQLYYWNNRFWCIYDACFIDIPKINARKVAKYMVNDWQCIFDDLQQAKNIDKSRIYVESYFAEVIHDSMVFEEAVAEALIALYPQKHFDDINTYMALFHNVEEFAEKENEYYENIIDEIRYNIGKLTKDRIEAILVTK